MSRDGKALLSSLQGKWKCVYSELGGSMTDPADFATRTIDFNGNGFVVEKNNAVAHEGTFNLNVQTSPASMVLIYSKSFPIFLGGPRSGIVQVEANTLKMCFAAIGQSSPKDFNTFPDSESTLSIYHKPGLAVASVSASGSVAVW